MLMPMIQMPLRINSFPACGKTHSLLIVADVGGSIAYSLYFYLRSNHSAIKGVKLSAILLSCSYPSLSNSYTSAGQPSVTWPRVTGILIIPAQYKAEFNHISTLHSDSVRECTGISNLWNPLSVVISCRLYSLVCSNSSSSSSNQLH